MLRQFFKQWIERGSVSLDERGNIIFVNTNTREVTLPIERWQRVQLEQHQPFDRRAGDCFFDEPLGSDMVLADFLKQGVARQQEINLQAFEIPAREVHVL